MILCVFVLIALTLTILNVVNNVLHVVHWCFLRCSYGIGASNVLLLLLIVVHTMLVLGGGLDSNTCIHSFY